MESDKYYQVWLTTRDRQGRQLKQELHVQGKQYLEPGDGDYYQYYHLEAPDPQKQANQVGETVTLTMLKNQQPLEQRAQSFLFYTTRKGLLDYQVQESPAYSFSFREEYTPNLWVSGVYFDGREYRQTGERKVAFDEQAKALRVQAHPDQEVYRPKDRVRVRVSVQDTQGRPVQAQVNVNLVDEALYALQDQDVDLLASLYHDWLPSLVFGTWSSHRMPQPLIGGAEQGGEGEGVREDFQDAVFFGTVSTDRTGWGEVSFDLPDNLNSWRVTYQAFTGSHGFVAADHA